MNEVLDRTSALPLWAQLEAALRRRLASGEFDDGFPTEAELIAHYGVSRPTVRQAVGALADDGLVVRTRGRGTEVVSTAVEQSLPGSYSMAKAISASGQTERSRVLVAERAPVPAEVGVHLGVDEGEEAIHVERLRLADDEPLAVDRSWFPVGVAGPLLTLDLTSGSLYDMIADETGLRPTGGEEQIEPARPDAVARSLLDLGPDGLTFEIVRHLWSGAQPFEFRVSTIRSDRYRLTNRWGGPP